MPPPVVSTQVLVLVIGTLVVVSAVLTIALVGVRAVRRVRTRRRDLRLDRLRPTLLLLLGGDPEEVDAATEALVGLPRRDRNTLEPALVAMLTKVRGESRAALVRVLDRQGTLAAARERLLVGGAAGRSAAAQLLAVAGVTEAVPAMLRLLSHPDAQLRLSVVRALGHLGPVDAAAPLLLLAGDPRDVPLPVLSNALARLPVVSEEDLARTLKFGSARQRSVAAEVSGIRQALTCAGLLQQRLQDDFDTDVRIRCARALGRLGLPRAVPDLVIAAAPGQPATLRAVATRALGHVGHRDAIPVLLQLCRDPDDRVAVNAAQSLLDCGDEGLAAVCEVAELPDGGHGREALQRAGLRGRSAAPARVP